MGNQFIRMFAVGPGDDTPDDGIQEFEQPAWLGPPAAELGVCVPLSVVIGRSDRAVVAVTHATAFSTGLTFAFVAAARGLREPESSRLFHEQRLFGGDEGPPDGFLRIGIELADGARVSNLGQSRHLFRPDAELDGPIFIDSGGGGGLAGAGRVTMEPGYWLWPLPPPGPLRVFVEWPALDVSLSSAELDAGLLGAAARQAQSLWVD